MEGQLPPYMTTAAQQAYEALRILETSFVVAQMEIAKDPRGTVMPIFCVRDDRGNRTLAKEIYSEMLDPNVYGATLLFGPLVNSFEGDVASLAISSNVPLIAWALDPILYADRGLLQLFTPKSLGMKNILENYFSKTTEYSRQVISANKGTIMRLEGASDTPVADAIRKLHGKNPGKTLLETYRWQLPPGIITLANPPGRMVRNAFSHLRAEGAKTLVAIISVLYSKAWTVCTGALQEARAQGFDVVKVVYSFIFFEKESIKETITFQPDVVFVCDESVQGVAGILQQIANLQYTPPSVLLHTPLGYQLLNSLMGTVHYIVEPLPFDLEQAAASTFPLLSLDNFDKSFYYKLGVHPGLAALQMGGLAAMLYPLVQNKQGSLTVIPVGAAFTNFFVDNEISSYIGDIVIDSKGRRGAHATGTRQFVPFPDWETYNEVLEDFDVPGACAEKGPTRLHRMMVAQSGQGQYLQHQTVTSAKRLKVWSVVGTQASCPVQALSESVSERLPCQCLPEKVSIERLYTKLVYPQPNRLTEVLQKYPCPSGCFNYLIECRPCPRGKFRSDQDVECKYCAEGTFANHEGFSACQSCPDGATCPSAMVTPIAKAGFYRMGTGRITRNAFRVCNADVWEKDDVGLEFTIIPCAGDLCRGNNECAPRYSGILCRVCTDGSYATVPDGSYAKCVECPPHAIVYLQCLGVVAAWIAITCLLAQMARTGALKSSHIATPLLFSIIAHVQLVYMIREPRPHDLHLLPGVFRIVYNMGAFLTCPETFASVSCLFGGQNAVERIKDQAFVSFGFALAGYAIVVTIMLATTLLRFAKLNLYRCFIPAESEAQRRYESRIEMLATLRIFRGCVRHCLCWTLLMFPSVVRACARVLSCSWYANESRLTMDLSLRCYAGDLGEFQARIVIISILVATLVPLGLFVLVFASRNFFGCTTVRLRFGTLLIGYNLDKWWFGAFWMTRILPIGFLPLVNLEFTHYFMCGMFLLGYRVIQTAHAPYLAHDRFAIASVHSFSVLSLLIGCLHDQMNPYVGTGIFRFMLVLASSCYDLYYLIYAVLTIVNNVYVIPWQSMKNVGIDIGRVPSFLAAISSAWYGFHSVEIFKADDGSHHINVELLSDSERSFLKYAFKETTRCCLDAGDFFQTTQVIEAFQVALERAGERHAAFYSNMLQKEECGGRPRARWLRPCCGGRRRATATTAADNVRREAQIFERCRKYVMIEELYYALVDVNTDVMDRASSLRGVRQVQHKTGDSGASAKGSAGAEVEIHETRERTGSMDSEGGTEDQKVAFKDSLAKAEYVRNDWRDDSAPIVLSSSELSARQVVAVEHDDVKMSRDAELSLVSDWALMHQKRKGVRGADLDDLSMRVADAELQLRNLLAAKKVMAAAHLEPVQQKSNAAQDDQQPALELPPQLGSIRQPAPELPPQLQTIRQADPEELPPLPPPDEPPPSDNESVESAAIGRQDV
eukprot:TRINITY_DN18596_c0_g2_i1.p1 TRINITY_DN18596_c0_g2~~TRINITY_DN18596_c0_g2_i1.p1  ORF type:complete len:1563 (+),score=229.80 TRINITY_DN18596_c0_g2_i1:303-4691(+)